MKIGLLRQIISTLSGYSNPHNWECVEGKFIWAGVDDPTRLAKDILDMVATETTLMHKKEPDNLQYELFDR